MLNLSDSGLLLETEASLKPGEALDVVLPEAGMRTARVVWAGHGLAGCKFDAPLGKSALSAAALASVPVSETMGQRLRRLRRERGDSMVRLAQHLGVSKQTLWNWETDRTLPQPRFLAELLGVEPGQVEVVVRY